MKRYIPLVAIALLALLGPASALAAPSANATTARYFEIKGLALGGLKIEASGKLAIDGTQLAASAGCNMIGGTVTIDGDVVTLVGPTFMTEMACPGAAGDAEALLIKILQLGTFTITDGAWIADGGEIVTVELTSVGPVPAGSPPDEPVTSSPAATIAAPAPSDGPGATCPPIPTGTNSTIIDVGPAGGSGGGSTGSGGSSGSGVITSPPDEGTAPGSKPGSEPGATPGIDVPPPAPGPEATSAVGPVEPEGSPTFVLPDPIGQDPNVGKPAGDPCLGYATGGVVADGSSLPKAVDLSAEHASLEAPGQAAARVAVALGLFLIVIVAGFYRPSPAAPIEATEAGATPR